MLDITQRLNMYRECVRNLWNVHYFHSWMKEEDIDDLVDEFENICTMIFSSLILNPLGAYDYKKSKRYRPPQEAIGCLEVVPLDSGIPIDINREVKQSGYWDYPVEFVKQNDVRLTFIDCFDWGCYEFRDFAYYMVRIADSSLDSNLIGRDALIKTDHAKIYYTGDLQFDYRCSCQRN